MLDDLARVSGIDVGGMLDIVGRFPSLLESGRGAAAQLNLRIGDCNGGICFLGLGGSAIGGDLIRDWIGDVIPGGVKVERGYRLTAPLRRDSLIICCSYSGNTVETLSMLDQVIRSGCENILVISSDGELSRIARKRSFPLVELVGGIPPRASLPSVVSAIATVSDRVGWTKNASADIMTAAESCRTFRDSCLSPEVPIGKNIAKQLAHQIHGFIPVVIAPFTMESAARRWKTQMNENAKQHCFFGSFPEISHNEIIPWLRDARSRMFMAILLRGVEGADEFTRSYDRFGATISKDVKVIDIQRVGKTPIEVMLNHVLLSDFTSCYLAILSGIDPLPVDEIVRFKSRN